MVSAVIEGYWVVCNQVYGLAQLPLQIVSEIFWGTPSLPGSANEGRRTERDSTTVPSGRTVRVMDCCSLSCWGAPGSWTRPSIEAAYKLTSLVSFPALSFVE